MNLYKQKSLIPTVLTAALLFSANTILAQEQTATTAIEEIVVTTDFRDKKLLDTVTSHSIISNDTIQTNAATHLENLTALVPNLQSIKGGSRAKFFQIRGIGETEQFVAPIANPSVAVLVDGVDFSDIAIAASTLLASKVSVLRGNQPLNFGGSALAGSIQIESSSFNVVNNGSFDLKLGSQNLQQLAASYQFLTAENSNVYFAVSSETSDGHIKNTYLNRKDTANIDEKFFKTGYLYATAKDDVQLRLFSYDVDNGYDNFSLDNNRTTLSDQPGKDAVEGTAVSINWTRYLANDWQLQVFTAVNNSDSEYSYDEDWCNTAICSEDIGGYQGFDQYLRDRSLQQLYLTASNDTWLFGIYQTQKQTYLDRNSSSNSDYKINYQSIFTQYSYNFERWHLLVGLRYEDFSDDFTGSVASVATTSKDHYYAQQWSLSYDLSDNEKLFISYNIGYKPGGVNTEAVADVSASSTLSVNYKNFLNAGRINYETEKLTNIELGYKYIIANSRLQLIVFSAKRLQPQIETSLVDPATFNFVGYLDNAVSASNSGIEASYYTTIDKLALTASIGYLDTTITDLTVISSETNQELTLNGRRQSNAPYLSTALVLEYQFTDKLQLTINNTTRSDYYYAVYHQQKSAGESIVNMYLDYKRQQHSVKLWVNNLTNTQYPVKGFYFGNDPRDDYAPKSYTQLANPREIGVGYRYNY